MIVALVWELVTATVICVPLVFNEHHFQPVTHIRIIGGLHQ